MKGCICHFINTLSYQNGFLLFEIGSTFVVSETPGLIGSTFTVSEIPGSIASVTDVLTPCNVQTYIAGAFSRIHYAFVLMR